MKRFALSLAAVAVLATLTACGDEETETDQPKAAPTTETSEPTEDATPAEDRFMVAYEEVGALFVRLNEQEDVKPADAAEANAAAGLDDTTSLIFVDYSVLPDDETTGAFCLEADNDTFVSFAYSGAEGESTLGDGECSYDAADAEVVGDIGTDTWVSGADLMGDITPTSIFAG